MTVASELIMFGDADLLTGERPLRDDLDLIIVGRLPHRCPGREAPNTIIVRWADLGPITLTARTIDGRHIVQHEAAGGELYDGLMPGRALAELVRRIAVGRPASALVPLFYAITTPDSLGLRVYSRVDSTVDDACFLHIATTVRPADDNDSTWLRVAVGAHARHAPSLNSYQCHWRKAFPGNEIEYKYTLPVDAPIWTLAAETYRRILTGSLAGFTLKYRDELQAWDYLNELFDIDAPSPNADTSHSSLPSQHRDGR